MPLAEAHWALTSLAVMILIPLTPFHVGALIWRKCRYAQEQTMPFPLAPLMLMPIINSRPIYKAMKSNSSFPHNAILRNGRGEISDRRNINPHLVNNGN
jgi:hypothetical protein